MKGDRHGLVTRAGWKYEITINDGDESVVYYKVLGRRDDKKVGNLVEELKGKFPGYTVMVTELRHEMYAMEPDVYYDTAKVIGYDIIYGGENAEE